VRIELDIPDWGSLKIGSVGNEYAVSNVVEFSNASSKIFTITKDVYGVGFGDSTIYKRVFNYI